MLLTHFRENNNYKLYPFKQNYIIGLIILHTPSLWKTTKFKNIQKQNLSHVKCGSLYIVSQPAKIINQNSLKSHAFKKEKHTEQYNVVSLTPEEIRDGRC